MAIDASSKPTLLIVGAGIAGLALAKAAPPSLNVVVVDRQVCPLLGLQSILHHHM
jgi:NADH dehydrogenase FAD-containing subunit